MSQALSISLALQPALFHSTPSSSSSSTCIPGAHAPSSSILHLSRKSSSLSLSSASFPRSSSEPSLFLPRFRSRAGTTGATFIAPTPTPSPSTTDVLHVRSETSATRASHRSPLSSHNNNIRSSTIATNITIADSHATESTSVLDSIELSAQASGISSSTSCSSPTRSPSSHRRHSHSEVLAHSSHSEPTPSSPHQSPTLAADPSSVLWKAYTRVKQTIVENPNTQQLEKTMTDYWHSFSAPPQLRDLEEHIPADITLTSSVVSTLSPISTSTSSSSSQRTIVETGSLLKSSVRSASEQGLLLAQRSKTSLNRLLDTVMDNATTLAESSSANCAYSDSEDKPSLLIESTPTPARISPSSRQPSRAKFFVCDSDEEEDEEEEEFLFPRRSEDNFGDFEDSGTDEAETEENEESLVMRAPNTTSPKPAPGIVRRQSLLSDLFLAEKQREQLHPSKSIQPSLARTSSTYSSRCPSAANSDGESTFSRMAPLPEDHQDHGQHHHRRHHHHPHRINLDAGSEIQEPEKPKSPLVRTKRVFKNLDELASLSTTSPTCNISSPSSSSPSSPSSSPTALAAWTRSHQVQVQIQSLVVQSTSSAQRALLSASATLTDVLFRTK